MRGVPGLALALVCAVAVRADWPQFRGTPDHTGVASGTTGTMLVPLWSVQLPAVTAGSVTHPPRITGSPAIVGNRVFVGCQNTLVYAFEAETGSPVWDYEAGAPVHSSPLVRDGAVYFSAANGDLVALDSATGGLRWEHSSGGFQDQSSPNSVLDLVVCGATFPQRKVYAVSRATGGPEQWRFETGQPVFSSPAVDPASGAVVCGSNDGLLYAIRPDGTAHWPQPFRMEGGIFLASPSIANGRAYLCPGNFDTKLYAVDMATGTLAWEAPVPPTPPLPPGVSVGITVSSPAVDGAFVFVMGGYGNDFGPSLLHAFRDAGTEALPLWTVELPNNTSESFVSSPALTPSHVIVGVAARPDAAHPILPRGRVYLVDRITGAARWYAAGDPSDGVHGGPILSSPAVSNDLVVVGDDSGLLSAYRLVVAGDLDGDGVVTLLDTVTAARAVAGGQWDDPALVERADLAPVDVPRADGARSFGDGQVTGGDVIRLLRRCAGLDDGLWP